MWFWRSRMLKKEWGSWDDPRARATRGLGRMRRERPGAPPCSQNAHGETVLVRCAQLRAALATPLEGSIGNWKALAWDNARPWAKRLSWQTQGGRVKYPPGWGG